MSVLIILFENFFAVWFSPHIFVIYRLNHSFSYTKRNLMEDMEKPTSMGRVLLKLLGQIKKSWIFKVSSGKLTALQMFSQRESKVCRPHQNNWRLINCCSVLFSRFNNIALFTNDSSRWTSIGEREEWHGILWPIGNEFVGCHNLNTCLCWKLMQSTVNC